MMPSRYSESDRAEYPITQEEESDGIGEADMRPLAGSSRDGPAISPSVDRSSPANCVTDTIAEDMGPSKSSPDCMKSENEGDIEIIEEMVEDVRFTAPQGYDSDGAPSY